MKRIATLIITALFLASTAGTTVSAITNAELQMIRGDYPFHYNYEPCAPTANASGASATIKVGSDLFMLPASRGFTGYEDPIDENGKLIGKSEHVKYARFAKLGQEYRDYYITMRWTTHKWFWSGDNAQMANQKQEAWMGEKPRFVIVTNPKNQRSIIAPILEAGPAPWTGVDTAKNDIPKNGWNQPQLGTAPGYQGRVSGFPPVAIDFLQVKQRTGGKQDGDELFYAWHPNQDEAKPGPTTLSAVTTGPDATQCLNQGDTGGSGVSPDGFVFPLRTTKAKLKNNPYYKPDCNNPVPRMGRIGAIEERDDLCHHDYLAADIQTPAGTKVLAPRPGRIARSGASANPCIKHNLSLFSDPKLGGDGNTYYFAHLSDEDQASKNDIVKAGDVIGTVATGPGIPKCNFMPHLHFDISPDQESFQRDSDGTRGPLLDPQPPLRAAFNNLPEN
ncbi:MAG TPA: M23 family metallopeptidase [Candidatus Saccharimonadales bacterium]|nr:M23 family metallopeptidase [Candidatus Saccharimonadales bacterium]